MKRDFSLPEQDTDFLATCGFQWEAVRDPTGSWVIFHDYPIPAGYNIKTAKLAIKIDPGYPASQIDMVYFSPELKKLNASTINALTTQIIQGVLWQRWSRHRTGENPWRPEIDDISTHLQLVNFWLERELKK